MLTDWLDSVLEEPSRQMGFTAERLAIQAGGGALAAAANIAFEEFTTTLINTIGKALLGVGLVATASEQFAIPTPIPTTPIDDRTKQELLIIGSAIGLDGIYRAVRNMDSTQAAVNQFLDTLRTGNILGALQMLIKNPFGPSTSSAIGSLSYSPLGTVNIVSPVTSTSPATGYGAFSSYEYGYGGEEELTVPTL